MTELDLPPITLPAENVITAWHNAYAAAGNGDDAPALSRTVLVEWHDDGLNFVGTDGLMLVVSYAGGNRLDANPLPELDDAPIGAVVAHSKDRLMADFLKHRAAEVKAYDREDGPGPIDVTFSLGTIDEPGTGQQKLNLDLGDELKLIVSSDAERIALPLSPFEFPNWRRVLSGMNASKKARQHVQILPDLLHRIGTLGTRPHAQDDAYLRLTMTTGGTVLVDGSGQVPLRGGFMRHVEDAEAEEGADRAA